jgi:methyltransferase
MGFFFFIGLVVAIRVAELVIARSNERWARARGAKEYGSEHYPFIVSLHTLFLVSCIVEYLVRKHAVFQPVFFGLFLFFIAMKIWVIASLGHYWNTKILRVPDTPLVAAGPYKYLKHPNYLIVVAEIVLIPLTYQLYVTALVFTLLNALMLSVRVRVENGVLEGK